MVMVRTRWLFARARVGCVALAALVLLLATACRVELGALPGGYMVAAASGTGTFVLVGHGNPDHPEYATWDPKTGNLQPLPLGGAETIRSVQAVSRAGLAVGSLYDPGAYPYPRAAAWDLASGEVQRLALPENAQWSQAMGVSETGIVVGEIVTDDGPPSYRNTHRAARWDLATGRVEVLAGRASVALGVNDGGEAVGFYYSSGTSLGDALAWPAGSATGRVLTVPGAMKATARSINSAGEIVGFGLDAGFAEQAVRWAPGATEGRSLPDLGGKDSRAVAVNDAGVVTGESDRPDGSTHAMRIDAESTTALDLSAGDAHVTGSYVVALSPTGSVYGIENGVTVVRWDPDPPPPPAPADDGSGGRG